MIASYWHHTRMRLGGVKCSTRFTLAGGESSEPHLLIEEVVMQSPDQLQLQDNGTEHNYPTLRRRR